MPSSANVRGWARFSLAVADRAIAVTVREMHQAVSDGAFRWLGPIGRPIKQVHDAAVGGIYGAVHAGLRGAGELAEPAPSAATHDADDASPSSLKARAIANGALDERLLSGVPELDPGVTLRHEGREVVPGAGGLHTTYPAPSGQLVVFVHGLVDTEAVWSAGPGLDGALPNVALGAGATPLFVRYSTGRAIGRNGADLAALLDAVVGSWPVPVTKLVIVGHSMGGLVARAACAAASRDGHRWLDPLTDVVYLATPHLGSWLEKVANVGTWTLRHSSRYSAPFGRLIDLRSRGIKDLRFGTLAEDNWATSPIDGLLTGVATDDPWLDGVDHHVVAGRLRAGQRDPLNAAFGDGLVRSGSAVGRGRRRRIDGVQVIAVPVHGSHSGIVQHPEVVGLLERVLDEQPAEATVSASPAPR